MVQPEENNGIITYSVEEDCFPNNRGNGFSNNRGNGFPNNRGNGFSNGPIVGNNTGFSE